MPSLPADVDAATRQAITMRMSYGLRHDLEWVRHVAAQPSVDPSFGFPLLPAETASLFARSRLATPVQEALAAYGHQDEFAGLWLDNELGGVVVVAWTGHVAEHAAAVRAELPACHPVLFRQVRWSLAQLNTWRDRVFADWDWFAEIPAATQGLGARETENAVVIEISSANPDAERLILEHYGAPPGLIKVVSDGTGAKLLPWGTVRGRVISTTGSRVDIAGLSISYEDNGVIGSCATEPFGPVLEPDGDFQLLCQAGRRRIIVTTGDHDAGFVTVATADVEVVEGHTVHVDVRLPENFTSSASP